MNATAQTPWLLTPGPLTTSAETKAAMCRDWGSRDQAFIDMTATVRERLVALAHAESTHVCVPIQGSGTFAVEATLGTLIPPSGHVLILVNGAYGHRMAKICEYNGRRAEILEWAEDQPVEPEKLEAALTANPSISHVLVVHCETTSGIINPVADISTVCEKHGRALLIDAMSSFGALELDARTLKFDALMASSNKCLEGVPGLGFALISRAVLAGAAGNSTSLSLDLHAQWRGFEDTAQWRFTPPTHVLAALAQALDEHAAEGGVEGRGQRYARNCETLISGMQALGFTPLLPNDLQAPIIVTFHMPADPAFDFAEFYEALAARGFVIYPGKLTVAPTFRIGCIGHLGEAQMRGVLSAISEVLSQMGVAQCGRAA
jgi:2-aminoethylphosphonate-pyruvate transaminase